MTFTGPARTCAARRCSAPALTVAVGALSAADATCLFGRIAEAKVHLDSEVGMCCHSACSDCEWRSPDGGYRCALCRACASAKPHTAHSSATHLERATHQQATHRPCPQLAAVLMSGPAAEPTLARGLRHIHTRTRHV